MRHIPDYKTEHPTLGQGRGWRHYHRFPNGYGAIVVYESLHGTYQMQPCIFVDGELNDVLRLECPNVNPGRYLNRLFYDLALVELILDDILACVPLVSRVPASLVISAS